MFKSRRAVLSGDMVDQRSLAFTTNEYLYIYGGNADLFEGTTTFTSATWIKTDVDENEIVYGATGAGIYLRQSNSTDMLFFVPMDGDDFIMSKSGFHSNDGGWHHVAATMHRSGSNNIGEIYLDGVSIQTTSTSSGTPIDTNRAPNSIGRQSDKYHEGKIADFAFYSSCLGDDDIKKLYNNGQPYNHAEGSFRGDLVGWWRMGDGQEQGKGATIYDMSSNGYDATLTNMDNSNYTNDVPW